MFLSMHFLHILITVTIGSYMIYQLLFGHFIFRYCTTIFFKLLPTSKAKKNHYSGPVLDIKVMGALTISNKKLFSKLRALDWVQQSHPIKVWNRPLLRIYINEKKKKKEKKRNCSVYYFITYIFCSCPTFHNRAGNVSYFILGGRGESYYSSRLMKQVT